MCLTVSGACGSTWMGVGGVNVTGVSISARLGGVPTRTGFCSFGFRVGSGILIGFALISAARTVGVGGKGACVVLFV